MFTAEDMCMGYENSYRAHPLTCTSRISCGGPGQPPIENACPGGLIINGDATICEFPFNSPCSDGTITVSQP